MRARGWEGRGPGEEDGEGVGEGAVVAASASASAREEFTASAVRRVIGQEGYDVLEEVHVINFQVERLRIL